MREETRQAIEDLFEVSNMETKAGAGTSDMDVGAYHSLRAIDAGIRINNHLLKEIIFLLEKE